MVRVMLRVRVMVMLRVRVRVRIRVRVLRTQRIPLSFTRAIGRRIDERGYGTYFRCITKSG